MPIKEDRRIRRTKKLLRQGLAELMNEKEFKDITVKDITERMDMNRGTFYLHYSDTYDLLDKVENELIEDFENLIDTYHPTEENHSAFVIIDQIFDYITENEALCKTFFLSKSSNRFLGKFMNVISKKGLEIQKELSFHRDPLHTEYLFTFLTYGMIGILHKWFSSDMKMPKAEIVDLLDKLLSTFFLRPEIN